MNKVHKTRSVKDLDSKDLIIAGHHFKSRLIIGTGKFPSPEIMKKALEASGTELVTVALRRVDLNAPADSMHA